MKSDNDKPHKGVLALMLGSPEHAADAGGDGGGDEDGLDIAAEEAMDAVHAKDPAALKDALKAFVQQCMDAYEHDEKEGDER